MSYAPLDQHGASFVWDDEKDERIFELSPPLPGPPREGGYRSECPDSIAGKLTARSRRPSSPPLLPCQTISFINATKHLSVAEHQEQDGRQAHRRLVRARRRSQDQEAGHQISAGILSAERRGEFQCTSPFQSVTLWSLLQILRFRETPSCLSCKKVLPHSP